MRSCFLKISNHDAVPVISHGDNDFVVTNRNHKLSKVKAIKVRSVAFRNTFYNTTEHNNYFNFEIDGVGVQSFTLPVGNYNLIDFISDITAKFNTFPSLVGTTVAIDTTTRKLSIITPVAIKWDSNDRKRTASNPISDQMGFHLYQNSYNTYNTTHTADGFVLLASPINLNIYSRTLANNNHVDYDSQDALDVLISVPIHNQYGGAEVYEAQSETADLIAYDEPRDLSTIDIRLRSNRGHLLPYTDNIVIVLQAYYK
jgi:hypothetical protein